MVWDLSHRKQAMETTSVCLPSHLSSAASSKGTLGTEALQAVVYRGRAQKNASLQLTMERGSQATHMPGVCNSIKAESPQVPRMDTIFLPYYFV